MVKNLSLCMLSFMALTSMVSLYSVDLPFNINQLKINSTKNFGSIEAILSSLEALINAELSVDGNTVTFKDYSDKEKTYSYSLQDLNGVFLCSLFFGAVGGLLFVGDAIDNLGALEIDIPMLTREELFKEINEETDKGKAAVQLLRLISLAKDMLYMETLPEELVLAKLNDLQEHKKDRYFKTCGEQSAQECFKDLDQANKKRLKIFAALVQNDGGALKELCKEPLSGKHSSYNEDYTWLKEKVINKNQQ